MTTAVDMRSKLPGARDQGARPTCLAFAMSDAHMLAAQRTGLFSADYLHFHAAKRANVGLNEGVGLSSVRDALESDGQPLEEECPYSAARLDTWVPPSDLTAIWTRGSAVRAGTPSDLLRAALDVHRAHVLVLRISRSFHAPDPRSHLVSEDGGKDRRLHAVVIIGMATVNGDSAFLARNSWGPGWGNEGHAWLPEPYIDARAINVIEFEVGGVQ